jgi:hypothetical protein
LASRSLTEPTTPRKNPNLQKTLLKNQLIIPILLVGIFCCSCTSQHQNNNTPTSLPPSDAPRNSVDVVKVTAIPAVIKPNESAEAIVQVSVQNGYHINANPPTFSYLKATELTLEKVSGISVSFIVYPNALTKSFAFADKPLAVYEGTTEIKVRLRADKSLGPSTQNLSGTLHVQACDNQVCYAPGTLAVSIPLSIK